MSLVVPSQSAHCQPGLLVGAGLEIREARGLSLFGDLRSDDVEDAPAAWPELGGAVHEVRRCQRHRRGVEVRRKGRQRPLDHLRLREGCAALPHRGREHRTVAVQRLGQTQVGPGVRVRRAGPLRQPAGGVLRCGLGCELACVGQDPQSQLGQLSLGPTMAIDFSSAVMKVGLVSLTAFRDTRTPATAPRIGCWAESWRMDMPTTLPAPTDNEAST